MVLQSTSNLVTKHAQPLGSGMREEKTFRDKNALITYIVKRIAETESSLHTPKSPKEEPRVRKKAEGAAGEMKR